MTTISTGSPFESGVTAGRASMLRGKSACSAARDAGRAAKAAGGDAQDARAAGEALVTDSDAPGYGVEVSQAGSNAVDAWIAE